MQNSNGKVAAAIRLTQPGSLFPPAAAATVIAAADQLEASGAALSRAEERVCQVASRLRLYIPASPPAPTMPPELAGRIAEAAATVEGRQLAHDAALEAVVLTRQREERASTREEGRRLAGLRLEAEQDYAHVRENLEHAIAALHRLYAERDAYTRAAALAASTS